MNRIRKFALAVCVLGVMLLLVFNVNTNPRIDVGDKIDELNGVPVYFNGAVGNVVERNIAPDGYNLGLKYQCVEYVKRYFYSVYGHRMPEDKGHAKDYFDPEVADGGINNARALTQYRNGGSSVPQIGDLLVFSPWILNRFGHVAIVSAVTDTSIEVIQQNAGPFGSSREQYAVVRDQGVLRVDHPRLLGWLRYQESIKAPRIQKVSATVKWFSIQPV